MRKPRIRQISMVLCCTVAIVPAGAVTAQESGNEWFVAVTAALAGFRGAAAEQSSSGDLAVRPSQGISLGFTAGRQWRAWGISLGLSHLPTHIEAVSGEVAVQDRTEDLERVRLEVTATRRLLRIGAGTLELQAGPALDNWSAGGEDGRTIVAAEAALAARFPAGPVALENVLGVGWSPGPFRADELPAGYNRKGLRAIMFGLRIRLGL